MAQNPECPWSAERDLSENFHWSSALYGAFYRQGYGGCQTGAKKRWKKKNSNRRKNKVVEVVDESAAMRTRKEMKLR
jgi:predicted adenine nucleotide alpha hydrolase (AANH) superfamily ATPase